MEQHVLDLVKTMNTQLNRVYVWCCDGEIVQWYKDAGAQVTTRNIGFDLDPFYIFRLATFLKKEKIEIIHAHELKAVINALIAAKIAGVPVMVSHTHTPISTWKVAKFKRRINTVIYSFIVNLLANTEIALTESRRNIKIEEGISEFKLKVIPNALDTTKLDIPFDYKLNYRNEIRKKYNIPSNAFLFGNISRLTEEKGHEILVRAFTTFLKYSIPDKEKIYLLIAGGGKLEEYIKTIVTHEGLEKRVFVTGVFDAADLAKFYSAFDVFVFPSLAEGFGIVLIEAMYAQLPIVCSDLEVFREVGGSAVFYFETGNQTDLAEKMLSLYQKKDLLEKLTNNARNRVEKLYTLEKFADSYSQLYTNLLETRK